MDGVNKSEEHVMSCLDIDIDEQSVFDGCKDLVCRLRPTWQPEDIQFMIFTEGYTNRLIACMLDDDVGLKQDVILVRVYGRGSELLIDRERERLSMVVFHSIGSAAQLFARFHNGIAYRYTPGVVLNYDLAMDVKIQRLIVKELVRIQSVDGRWIKSVLGNDSLFDKKPFLFTTLHRWISLIPDSFADTTKQSRFEKLLCSKEDLLSEVKCLDCHLSLIGSPVVLCHNDLLFKNIIYDEQRQKIRFIDFEYTAFNYQAFDIANHFCEFAGMETIDFSRYPSRSYQLVWLRFFLEEYFEQSGRLPADITDTDVERLYVQVNKFALAAHLMWAIWALVQADVSSINYDYMQFASDKLSEYRRRKEEFLNLQLPQ